MKIIGAGFGRTGTKSLQQALEVLGYGPCYHMEKLLQNPHHIKHWKKAYSGERIDWSEIFNGYNAAVDFPTCLFYKELMGFYPEAKVILTVRDPEAWYNSVSKTIYNFDPGASTKIKMLSKMPFSNKARNLFQALMANNKFVWDQYFEGRFEDKAYAIDKFLAHIEEVKSTVPEDKLLVYEVKDGWDALIKFLDKEEPFSVFPRTNKKEDFKEWAVGVVNEVL